MKIYEPHASLGLLRCPSFPGYFVTPDGGKVLSTRRRKVPRALTPFINEDGYLQVTIRKPGKVGPQSIKVHQLVADAVYGARPKFTTDQVLEIRERRKSGERVKSLASSFGVGLCTIENLLYGATYRSVQ